MAGHVHMYAGCKSTAGRCQGQAPPHRRLRCQCLSELAETSRDRLCVSGVHDVDVGLQRLGPRHHPHTLGCIEIYLCMNSSECCAQTVQRCAAVRVLRTQTHARSIGNGQEQIATGQFLSL